jgi:low temperature requirement protein LtrA
MRKYYLTQAAIQYCCSIWAYVLVVLELASTFLHDLTWHGLGIFVGLFTAIWFSWVWFTLYANRFDTDDVMFRAGKLLATLAIAGCAASAGDATADLALPFAASYAAGMIILLPLHVRAWRHLPDARPTWSAHNPCSARSIRHPLSGNRGPH